MDISEVYGLIKPLVDVHTMGLFTIANLLRDCGYKVCIAGDDVNGALENLTRLNNYGLVKRWIGENGITRLGFSYRLDPQKGCELFLSLYERLLGDKMFSKDGGRLKGIHFAGLPDTCDMVSGKTGGSVLVFRGDEPPVRSLTMLGVPQERIPVSVSQDDEYDRMRWNFAKELIESERYRHIVSPDHFGYAQCGKDDDSYLARLDYATAKHTLPIIRTHSGPYNVNREEALKEYNSWCEELAASGLLDVLSIGSSQLTQSHFGENWEGLSNGGGIPVNSEIEYRVIRENARPMLTRTYSGTKNVPELARIHERSLNISWHALSFWWFNELDGRGSNTLLENLREHFDAIGYIVTTGKPVEPNVPHHFAFRGCDDVSYIISGYLAAKACKRLGVRHLILQNMLNTPKYTIGIQDLAKGRTLIRLVRELEDGNFRFSLQSRAGLDYFSPDLEEAKIQLAAVTCLMDDLEPDNSDSPQIVHVVNYCEAVRLATPPVIKESIQITLSALREYRQARIKGLVPDMKHHMETLERAEELYEECKTAICILEDNIPNLYTPEGFEKVFTEGFLPVPYLLDHQRKYPKATMWKTAVKNGSVRVVDDDGRIISTESRYRYIVNQMKD